MHTQTIDCTYAAKTGLNKNSRRSCLMCPNHEHEENNPRTPRTKPDLPNPFRSAEPCNSEPLPLWAPSAKNCCSKAVEDSPGLMAFRTEMDFVAPPPSQFTGAGATAGPQAGQGAGAGQMHSRGGSALMGTLRFKGGADKVS